jgi:hypothetical protein
VITILVITSSGIGAVLFQSTGIIKSEIGRMSIGVKVSNANHGSDNPSTPLLW